VSFSDRNGALCAEEVPLEEIARRFGTPCYVYSRAAIESTYREFVAALDGRDALVCYSVKANSNLAVLALLARLGAGFDIVSGGELARVMAAGGEASKTLFFRRRQDRGGNRACAQKRHRLPERRVAGRARAHRGHRRPLGAARANRAACES